MVEYSDGMIDGSYQITNIAPMIVGKVFNDVNDNGTYDPDVDKLMSGVKVSVRSNNDIEIDTNSSVTATDSNGEYFFYKLPETGSYEITVTESGYTETIGKDKDNNNYSHNVEVSGSHKEATDTGFYKAPSSGGGGGGTSYTTLSVQKIWVDDNDANKARPSSIKVSVMNGENEAANYTLTAENDWKHTFSTLPKYGTGKLIEYTVVEEPVANYIVSHNKTTTGYTIKNIYGKETTETPKPTEDVPSLNYDDIGYPEGDVRPEG